MIFFDRKESRRDVIFPSKFVEISPFSVSHFSAQMTLPDTRNRTAPIFSRGLGLYENLVVMVGKGGGSIEASSATSASKHIRPKRTKEEEEVSFVTRELSVSTGEEGGSRD